MISLVAEKRNQPTQPVTPDSSNTLTVATSSDWHIMHDRSKYFSPAQYKELIRVMSDNADAIIVTGDIVDHPDPTNPQVAVDAAKAAAEVFAQASVPVILLLGNHDFNDGNPNAIAQILQDEGGAIVLDGQSYVIEGVGIAGTKGMGGGFGTRRNRSDTMVGEPEYRRLTLESEAENDKLAIALAQLTTARKLVAVHYAPITQTLEGEPVDLFNLLGSSQLEDIIDADGHVAAVVHGHAHHGSQEGHTQTGVPVYNVAIQVLDPQGVRAREFHPKNLFRQIVVEK
ncbi:MAG TPA: metallophosphoesterase [Patescibacteria group bacterium]|nr:metallophosphoesterase [Patescibacteria group bacterium]